MSKPKIGGPAPTLLAPDNCMLLLIDFQPTSFFTVQSIDRQLLIDNAVGLAKTAKLFRLPVVLTTVAAANFSGSQLREISRLFPEIRTIDRTGNNPWEDERVVAAVTATGRRKLLVAGLWTENCVVLPGLSALADGYQPYVVVDACGGISQVAHEMALEPMIQAGAIPVTWQAVMLELQRDWARRETAGGVMEIAKLHGGAQGQAALYAETMVQARDQAAARTEPAAGGRTRSGS